MMTRQDRLTIITAGVMSGSDNWRNDDEPNRLLLAQALEVLAEIERVCPEAATCPTCVVSKQAVKDAIRQRDEARDCGQEGVCAIAPGCQRHWAERNRELTALRPEDIIALGKYENQVADVKRGIIAAIAAQREKDAKIADAEREKWAEFALQAEIRKANAATDAGLEAAAQEAYEQRSRSGVAANIAAAIREGES